jgi:hypothetical protein
MLPLHKVRNLGDGGRDFRSTFPPPDVRPRGTGRNGWGHRVTAEAILASFVLVTGDDRGRVGMGRDSRGGAAAVCKTAGFAYRFESCPCHTTVDLRKWSLHGFGYAAWQGAASLHFPSCGCQ